MIRSRFLVIVLVLLVWSFAPFAPRWTVLLERHTARARIPVPNQTISDVQPQKRSLPVGEPCVILYHVGKAGGNSVIDWAHRQGLRVWSNYAKHDSSRSYFEKLSDRPESNETSIHNADIIMGHWRPFFGANRSFIDLLRDHNFTRKCVQWTILREPISLATSLLFFVAGFYGNTREERSKCMSDSALTDCIVAKYYRMPGPCCVRPRHQEFRAHICKQFLSHAENWNLHQLSGFHWNVPCNITEAKMSLAALDGVGFTEDFESVSTRLSAHLGIAAPIPIPHTHVTKRKRDFVNLSLTLQDAILTHHHEDIILHRWAMSKFA